MLFGRIIFLGRKLCVLGVWFALSIYLSACSGLGATAPEADGSMRKAIAKEELARKKYTVSDGAEASEASYNFMLGELALKENSFDKALDYFEEAADVEEKPAPSLRRRLVQLYLRKGDLERALSELNNSGSAANNNIELLKLKAGILATLKRNKEAIQAYERIVELNTSFEEEPYVFMASLYAQENDLESAKDVLRRVLEEKPNSFFANYYSAKIFLADGNFEEAESFYKQTISLNPNAESVKLELARVYAFQKRYDEAISILEQIVDKNPANAKARGLLGELLLGKDRIEEALEEFEAVQSLEDDSTETRFRIALIKLQQRDLAGAEVELSLITAENPEHSAARYYLATAYAGMKKVDEAVEQIRQISEGQKFYRESRMFGSFLLRANERYEGALGFVDELLDDTPDDIKLLNLKAALESNLGEYDDAIATTERIIALEPENDRHYFTLAVYHDENSDREKAIEVLEKVISINPNNANALNYLGYAFAEEGKDLGRAELLVRRALDIEKGNGYFLDSLGWVYYKMGRYEEALIELEKAVNIVTDDAVILEHFALALLKVGKRKEAIDALKRALDYAPESDDEEVEARIRKVLEEIEGS
jgi:tetratricopeptide (TPR) repeat protein